MWRLVTFGGLALESEDASLAPRVRPQRLSILAVLAAADRGVSRERMCSLFWPEADEEHARSALRQALYALRQELEADVVRADAFLTLDRGAISADVSEFRGALAAGEHERAARLAKGPFLHGFFLSGAPAFERWVEEERATLANEAVRAVLALARDAEAAQDLDAAADWWRQLTLLDPVSGRFALGFVRALAARGDRAGALGFIREHESVVQRELETDPDPDIRRLEAELRSLPSPVVDRTHPGPAAVSLERRRPSARIGVMAGVILLVLAATSTAARWITRSRDAGVVAVGMIREEGVPDTLRIGGVLTDMLSTNLARVAGFSVLANTRLFELMLPGQDTLALGYYDAARRAGATEIYQGRLLAGPQWGLALEMQRVELATGVVRGAYRVQANDRYALIDSMTAAIAHDLRHASPASSVADATTASPIAYKLYEEGLRALYQYDYAAALRLMTAALREDSTFAMAAYYDAVLRPGGDSAETTRRARALRLASRLPDRDRLTITANLLDTNLDPAALAVAESLATRFPGAPQSHERFATVLFTRGEWARARDALERAIAIDSASEPPERQSCRLCDDFPLLSNIYLWWDSLPALERTADRFQRLRPSHHYPWHIRVMVAAARGDTSAIQVGLRKFHEMNPAGVTPDYFIRWLIVAGDYAEAERRLEPLLQSPRGEESGNARWLKSILLRNQGRLAEARSLARGDPDDLAGAIVAMEQGDGRTAVRVFRRRAEWSESLWAAGVQARHRTWNHTLLAMALMAEGDTSALRPLADTVAYWGERSTYGRDRRAHHYVRGMLSVAEGHDADAAFELREAIHSPTSSFTRVNLELGRTLLRLNRPAEAVPVVRAALHGDVDGPNLYVSRTELHELLAQAFDRLAMRDSAAVHYRAVATAWASADPVFRARRDVARRFLVMK